MVSTKIVVSSVCFVSIAFLIGNISARPSGLLGGKDLDTSKATDLLGGGGSSHSHSSHGHGSHGHGSHGHSKHVHKTGGGGSHTHVHTFGGGDGEDGGKHVHRFEGSDGGDGGKHVHTFGGGNGGDGDVHTHVHKTESSGGKSHVHHYKTGGSDGGDGETHVHHFREEGPTDTIINEVENAAGPTGNIISEVENAAGPTANIISEVGKAIAAPSKVLGGGDVQDTIEVPEIFQGLDASLIEKLKSHKFGHFGVDSTQPKDCEDEYYFNDGVLKHFVRGTRDAGDALFSGVNNILQGILPEIGPVDGILDGANNGLHDILCGAENIFSDFADDFDSATHIAKHGLIDAFKFQNDGILAIPEGIVGIGGEAVEAAGSAVYDAVSGIGNGLADFLGAF